MSILTIGRSIAARLLCITLALAAVGCPSRSAKNPDSDSLPASNRIVAVSYALQYLTQRIAGDRIIVEFPAADSSNPREWKPSVDEIAAMQRADLIVVNGSGAEYAQWLVHATLPSSIICESCEELKLREQIAVGDFQIVHAHGPEGEHSHPYMVPYPWLDPAMAIKQSEKIAGCLTETWPHYASEFETNLISLKTDLGRLSKSLQALADNQRENPTVVLTANPHLKYLTRAAGLDDRHLLWFSWPNRADWPAEQAVLQQKIDETRAICLLISQQPGDPINGFLAETSIKSVYINPLDHRPDSGDFLSTMSTNIALLENVVKGAPRTAPNE